MRRGVRGCLLLAGLVWLALLSSPLQAQHPAQRDAAEEQHDFNWHVINSAIFGAIFVWAIWKYSPAFFNARSAEIQKAIQDATGLKLQADYRHSEIDRKMATLPAEIQRLREEAQRGMDREKQRRNEETQRELRKIDESLQAEIVASRAEAERQLRRRSALEALQAAERQLQEQAHAGETDGYIPDLVRLVERGRS